MTDKEQAKAIRCDTIARSNGVKLKSEGRLIVGLCPLHNERTPSFKIFQDTNTFKCFGCDKHGDSIALYCYLNGLDQETEFSEAIRRMLQEFEGIIPEPIAGVPRISKQAIGRPDPEVYEAFRELCPTDHPGREYLHERGLTNETINQARIFFLDDPKRIFEALRDRFGLERLEAAGIANKKGISFYRNPIIFPFYSLGKIKYLQGRAIGEGTPKYCFPSGIKRTLYGFDQLPNQRGATVYLCEGVLDALAVQQYGYPAVAIGGKELPQAFADQLKPYRIKILFDGDQPGKDAAKKAAELLPGSTILTIPGGLDPAEYLKAKIWINYKH